MENITEEKPKITVNDFKNWIKGVIEMQDDDWVPDAKQWNKILTKIYEIDDSQPTSTRPPQGPVYRGEPQFAQTLPLSTTPMSTAPMTTRTELTGPISTGNGQMPIKTPNIDGNYDTPFV